MLPPWAKRIFERLDGLGPTKTQVGLAQACGINKVSVSNWKGKGTATAMISGDNLVAAAEYLETTAEWIMTGATSADASQPAGLDLPMLRQAFRVAEAGGGVTPENVADAYQLLLEKVAPKAPTRLKPKPSTPPAPKGGASSGTLKGRSRRVGPDPEGQAG